MTIREIRDGIYQAHKDRSERMVLMYGSTLMTEKSTFGADRNVDSRKVVPTSKATQ